MSRTGILLPKASHCRDMGQHPELGSGFSVPSLGRQRLPLTSQVIFLMRSEAKKLEFLV